VRLFQYQSRSESRRRRNVSADGTLAMVSKLHDCWMLCVYLQTISRFDLTPIQELIVLDGKFEQHKRFETDNKRDYIPDSLTHAGRQAHHPNYLVPAYLDSFPS
jgi:hypothetical protein